MQQTLKAITSQGAIEKEKMGRWKAPNPFLILGKGTNIIFADCITYWLWFRRFRWMNKFRGSFSFLGCDMHIYKMQGYLPFLNYSSVKLIYYQTYYLPFFHYQIKVNEKYNAFYKPGNWFVDLMWTKKIILISNSVSFK